MYLEVKETIQCVLAMSNHVCLIEDNFHTTPVPDLTLQVASLERS